ncbi:MAG: ATP-binding cassette domain-containing protein [Clostridiales bacterium]|nr:ATP-binding cassette domain-containing protein [Clostridiales bacterium]
MSKINISNLTFCYDGATENILADVTVTLDTDWKTGLIGRNGTGKTTLLRLLAGILTPAAGTVSIAARTDFFPYAVNNPDNSVTDVIGENFPTAEIWRVEKELNQFDPMLTENGVMYRIFSTLSPGEQTKLLLCVLFAKGSNYLLIDEPTNHLDAYSRVLLQNYLCKKSGFLLVSHDAALLDACIDHVVSINRTGIDVVKGNFSTWYENKQNQDALDEQKNRLLNRDIARLKSAARQTAEWAEAVEKSKRGAPDKGYVGHKAAKMMKRSTVLKNRLEAEAKEKSALLQDAEKSEALKIFPLVYKKTVLVEAKNMCLRTAEREIFKNISFTVANGDRVALIGKNGSGKSSIIKLILNKQKIIGGASEPLAPEGMTFTGELGVGSALIISYIPQDMRTLRGSLNDFASERKLDKTLLNAILRRLNFSYGQLSLDMSDYSLGQKKKALIAAALCRKAHLYIFDEPLNYIDIISRKQIEELISACAPTALFIEHDAAFVKNVATKIIEL